MASSRRPRKTDDAGCGMTFLGLWMGAAGLFLLAMTFVSLSQEGNSPAALIRVVPATIVAFLFAWVYLGLSVPDRITRHFRPARPTRPPRLLFPIRKPDADFCPRERRPPRRDDDEGGPIRLP